MPRHSSLFKLVTITTLGGSDSFVFLLLASIQKQLERAMDAPIDVIKFKQQQENLKFLSHFGGKFIIHRVSTYILMWSTRRETYIVHEVKYISRNAHVYVVYM